jgi:hypothetical protein
MCRRVLSSPSGPSSPLIPFCDRRSPLTLTRAHKPRLLFVTSDCLAGRCPRPTEGFPRVVLLSNAPQSSVSLSHHARQDWDHRLLRAVGLSHQSTASTSSLSTPSVPELRAPSAPLFCCYLQRTFMQAHCSLTVQMMSSDRFTLDRPCVKRPIDPSGRRTEDGS